MDGETRASNVRTNGAERRPSRRDAFERRYAVRIRPLLAALASLAVSAAAAAQTPPLTVPQPSPEATVEQTVGITKLEIRYHRPAVNKRKVWGELVPYGEVWRAGANENTVFVASSDVSVEGQKLAAGTYGLHMIPTEKDWTVIFSKMADAWGSFSYDQKEDALRVTVTPRKAPFTERLAYSFEDPTDQGTTAVLAWEEIAVPFKISVDTPAVVVESVRRELRGLPRFSWQGWNAAAAYCARAGVNLDEALTWADRSVTMNENFTNLRTKALIVEKKGDAATAASLRSRALTLATETEINLYGYQLLGEKKYDEAIAIFAKNVKDHPKSWNTYDSLGEAYMNKGDKKLATQNYEQALSLVKDDVNKQRISGVLTRLRS